MPSRSIKSFIAGKRKNQPSSPRKSPSTKRLTDPIPGGSKPKGALHNSDVFTTSTLARTLPRLHRYRLSLAAAYSTRFNFRRLESHTHGIWNYICEDLIEDLSTQAVTFAQLTVSSSPFINKHSADTSLDSISPARLKEVIPDFTGVYIGTRLRGQPLPAFERVELSELGTLPMPPEEEDLLNAFCKVPRGYRVINNLPTGGALGLEMVNWHLLKLSAFATLFHAELKRPVSRRSLTAIDFFTEVNGNLGLANSSAAKQADLIFKAEPDTNMVVTILTTGEWWSFKISTRSGKAEDLFVDDEEYKFLDDLHSAPQSSRQHDFDVSDDALDLMHSDAYFQSPEDAQAQAKASRYRRGRLSGIFPYNPARDIKLMADPSDQDHSVNKDGLEGKGKAKDMWGRNIGKNKQGEVEDDPGTEVPSGSESEPEPGDASFVNAPFYFDEPNEASTSPPPTITDPNQGNESGYMGGTSTAASQRHRYLQHPDPTQEEPVVFKLRDALPKANATSKMMLLGTPSSNQRFYLIRQILKRRIAQLKKLYPPLKYPEDCLWY